MLAAAVPAPASAAIPYLAGWLLAGIIAQPTLLWIWMPLQAAAAPDKCAASSGSIGAASRSPDGPGLLGNAVSCGMAMALAVLLTRLFKVDHAFWVVLGVLPVLSVQAGSPAAKVGQEQAGTLIGFLVGALVLMCLGAHQEWYWVILPVVVFASAYAAEAVGFMAGQAAFTVFAVVLFCILAPSQSEVGMHRLEDIAMGGALSVLVGLLRGPGRMAVIAARPLSRHENESCASAPRV